MGWADVHPWALRHCRRGANPVLFLVLIFKAKGFRSPIGRATYFWHCPKVGKRLGTERGVLIGFLRIKIPCASRSRRPRDSTLPATHPATRTKTGLLHPWLWRSAARDALQRISRISASPLC